MKVKLRLINLTKWVCFLTPIFSILIIPTVAYSQQSHNKLELFWMNVNKAPDQTIEDPQAEDFIRFTNLKNKSFHISSSLIGLFFSGKKMLPDTSLFVKEGITIYGQPQIVSAKKDSAWTQHDKIGNYIAIKAGPFNNVDIEDLTVEKMWLIMQANSAVFLHAIHSKCLILGTEHNDGQFPLITYADTEKEIVPDTAKIELDTLEINHQTIELINNRAIKNIVIFNCHIGKPAYIQSRSNKEISLSNMVFQNDTSFLNIISQSSKTTLLLDSIDASKINFDYSRFHFQYFLIKKYNNDYNAWHSDIIKIYTGIIASQTRLGNQEGIRDASIEMAIFKDTIIKVGPIRIGKLISWVRIAWNNYGFDKMQVIYSSSCVFLFFTILNFLLFKKIIAVYEITEISAARQRSFDFKYSFSRFWYRYALSVLYSGIIFYGLKFDISNLKITKMWYVILLVTEYVIGIISLAYIANLIITK